MVTDEIIELATLIYPLFSELNPKDEVVYDHYIMAARRVWDAGWRKQSSESSIFSATYSDSTKTKIDT